MTRWLDGKNSIHCTHCRYFNCTNNFATSSHHLQPPSLILSVCWLLTIHIHHRSLADGLVRLEAAARNNGSSSNSAKKLWEGVQRSALAVSRCLEWEPQSFLSVNLHISFSQTRAVAWHGHRHGTDRNWNTTLRWTLQQHLLRVNCEFRRSSKWHQVTDQCFNWNHTRFNNSSALN